MDITEVFQAQESQSDKAKSVILEGLNDEQKAAATDYTGFSVVFAGAGVGKTLTLVRRTAYMINEGIPAANILLFTFTKKAAKEIHGRVKSFIGDEGCGVTVSTYHSFCARQLRRYASYLGYHDNFSIIDDEPQKKIVSKILKDSNSHTKPEIIISLISGFKDKHLTPRQAAEKYGNDYTYQEAVFVYERYQQALKKNNAMDFDDLLFNMTTILEQNEVVRQQIHSRYKWIVSDESQDSSVLDLKFIFLLTNPSTMNLCLIGDDNQSIYAFRGANVDHFTSTINSYKHKTFILNKNYRSTPEIVNAAEALIKYNPQAVEKGIVSMQKSGEKILDLCSRNQVHEAQQIASIIQNGVASGELKYKDVAILFRNSFLTRNVENAFVHAGIPYQMVSGVGFYERKEIKDILSFLDFLVNPENLTSFERIVNIPKRGLGEKSVEKITQITSQKYASYAIISVSDTLKIFSEICEELSGKAKKGFQDFISTLSDLYNFIQNEDPEPAKIIDKLVKIIKYNEYLEDYDSEGYDQRLLNIVELKNIAATYTDIKEFLGDILTSRSDTKEDDNNKVNLMTMHASKGLEYRLVIIADAVEGIVPSWRCESATDMQEERRLFYVAMTRAKENLVICHPETMLQKGRPARVHPSTFISQISSEYLTTMAG